MLDVFNTDAFGVRALTAAIQALPYKPGRISGMGLFATKGVTTPKIAIEEKDGVLALIPSVRRGGPANLHRSGKRRVRSFECIHLPLEDEILADDLLGVRSFGSEDSTDAVAAVVNEHLSEMRASHEVTWEHLLAGALNGKILDADGTELYDLFDEFGITEQEVDFVLGTDTTDIKAKCIAVKRSIEASLGNLPYDHIHALCGKTFFDSLTSHAYCKTAYQWYQEGSMLRKDARDGWEFAGVIFEEWRGSIGDRVFISDTGARFFPVGVPGLYVQHFAPADFVETVNTVGQPLYAKQERLQFDRGIKLHTQSNPLPLCLRPKVLVKGLTSN